ncbi:MAG TPA: NAD(P)/FAD-dependent oxidoreductase [Thermomicrobiaceae bacterium]|nr:NAD(P)/FAD-dependent oxidoreductase [Thermomicrobiaceae bacterium]
MRRGSAAEVVIVGAGLAGMTAAYELRDRDVVVIDADSRVGGRTLSGDHGDYWYNSGAQFVWDPRTLALCRQLGLEVIDGEGARSAIFLRGRLVEAGSPYGLLLRMPLSTAERIDFGRAVLRLRRMADHLDQLDHKELDARSLEDLVGRVRPVTREILDNVTENGAGLGLAEVSGWIGLAYAIHLFGGDVNETLKAVRGGTQRIARAVAERLDPERFVLGAPVRRVAAVGGEVEVSYRRDGQEEKLLALRCIIAVPAPAVLELVPGLPAEKRAALEPMGPYAEGVSVAWLTDEEAAMPWDRLLAVPVIGASFELFSNNSFFARRRDLSRRPGGTFVTLSISAGKGGAAAASSDAEIRTAQLADLKRMFPAGAAVLDRATTHVKRWRALPRFGTGWLGSQSAIRAPFGNIHFCGDYTAQPGTPGAVGSGHHAAAAVRRALGVGPIA